MQIKKVLNLPPFCFIDDTLVFTTNSEALLVGVEALIPLKNNKYFQDVFILAFSLHKRKEEAAEMSDNNLSSA